MLKSLLRTGEFAKFARTTKRTVLFYDEKGVLKPHQLDQSGYRYYRPEQIIDFQVIFLLRKLNFSLEEIKDYLVQNKSLKDLFKIKEKLIREEIKRLQKAQQDVKNYYQNLDYLGTLVKPQIKKVKPFWIYYLYKEGPYAKIKDYGLELKAMFKKIPKNAIFLTIFEEREYKPKKTRMKIGVVYTKQMQLLPERENIVKKEKIPAYKALSYTHEGSSILLSFLWQELEKYRKKNHYKVDSTLPFIDLEFYKPTLFKKNEDGEEVIFEINLPIL